MGWDECCCQNCPRVFWLEAHSQKVYLFFPWTGAGPLTLGRSSQRWDVGWGCGACLTCTRVLSPASSWFTATPHSYLSPFILFYFYKNPLLPRGLYDEVNLSCAYLEPVSRRKKCQLLVFKNRLREHAFFLCCFFSPLLADCLVVLTDERKIKTPSVIRHSRLVFVWLAI